MTLKEFIKILDQNHYSYERAMAACQSHIRAMSI